MKGALTPAWTLIIVPPTPRASPRRVGVRMRTVRMLMMLSIGVAIPLLGVGWSWVDTQTSNAALMADRLAAQEQMMSVLTDSLDAYRHEAEVKRAAKLPPPDMIMPLSARITSRFSHRRLHPILRINRPHRGVDIAAAAGTRIVAPAVAIVASVRRTFGFGLVVELVHSGGVVTRYAHCRSSLVRAGDQVAMGQPIATVGSSGLATSPHLHFEVLFKGRAVDPVTFLARTRTPTDSVQPPSGVRSPAPVSD
jgi:murein DD-endopeptidase MepM/ murein hydrolase activator NlpD